LQKGGSLPRRFTEKKTLLSGEEHQLTSGDLARMLHVDLKTIHNWVNQGHITGRRTKGRHLRFNRTEAVRFMRAYGYPIPTEVGAPPPRVVLDLAPRSRSSLRKSLQRGIDLTVCEGLYAAALAVASGDQEVVVFDLDQRDMSQVRAFMTAIRGWRNSQGLVLIGVGRKPASRVAFLHAGGDVAIAASKETDLRGAAKWLTAGSEIQPQSLEFAGA
jgi:excisionase family DNA binding protein